MKGKRFFIFQADDGIREALVTGVQTCALPICPPPRAPVWQSGGREGGGGRFRGRRFARPGRAAGGFARPGFLGRSEERRVGNERSVRVGRCVRDGEVGRGAEARSSAS